MERLWSPVSNHVDVLLKLQRVGCVWASRNGRGLLTEPPALSRNSAGVSAASSGTWDYKAAKKLTPSWLSPAPEPLMQAGKRQSGVGAVPEGEELFLGEALLSLVCNLGSPSLQPFWIPLCFMSPSYQITLILFVQKGLWFVVVEATATDQITFGFSFLFLPTSPFPHLQLLVEAGKHFLTTRRRERKAATSSLERHCRKMYCPLAKCRVPGASKG